MAVAVNKAMGASIVVERKTVHREAAKDISMDVLEVARKTLKRFSEKLFVIAYLFCRAYVDFFVGFGNTANCR